MGAGGGRRADRRRDRARRHGGQRRSSKPWVVSWPLSTGSAPLGVERTVQAAVRRETGSDAGRRRSALGQWVRRALPVTRVRAGPDRRRGPARRADLRVRRARPGAATSRCSTSACDAFGRAAVRAVGGARRRRPARRARLRRRARRHRHAAQRPAGLERAADRRLAAAARAARRARRVLPRPPPARADRAAGSAGSPSPPCRCRSRGCGCGCSARPGAIDVPAGPVIPAAGPLETSGIVALASAARRGRARLLRRAARGARAPARARPRPRSRRATAARAAGARRRGPGGRDGGLARRRRRARLGAQPVRRRAARPRRAPVAVRRRRLARAGGAGRAAAAASLVPVLALVHLGLALDLGPHELAWGWALGGDGRRRGWARRCCSRACSPRSRASLRVLLARRRIARDGTGEDQIRTRGPLSYAGPGSLGGTESALRR